MGYIIFILISLALLAGFLLLTDYETRRGTRLFARERDALDSRVSRVEFILTHVDFWSFMREELRRVGSRIGHDIVRLSLEAVRAVERLLTRLVRRLRPHHIEENTTYENVRPFVKTLSDFKDRLKKAARSKDGDVE